MGIKDKAKEMQDKAKDMQDKVPGKTHEYMDKAKGAVSNATGHKSDDKMDEGSDMSKDAPQKGNMPDQQH
jgi:hypothetical protein